MARPRLDSDIPPAKVRLSQAFWNFALQDSIGNITVAGLSHAAGVSHNTFYYYFSSIEDMAERLIDETRFDTFARELIEAESDVTLPGATQDANDVLAFADSSIVPDKIRTHFMRLCAVARNGTPHLIAYLKESLVKVWLLTVGCDKESLTREKEMKLSFMSGGILSALATVNPDTGFVDMVYVLRSELGETMRNTLNMLGGGEPFNAIVR